MRRAPVKRQQRGQQRGRSDVHGSHTVWAQRRSPAESACSPTAGTQPQHRRTCQDAKRMCHTPSLAPPFPVPPGGSGLKPLGGVGQLLRQARYVDAAGLSAQVTHHGVWYKAPLEWCCITEAGASISGASWCHTHGSGRTVRRTCVVAFTPTSNEEHMPTRTGIFKGSPGWAFMSFLSMSALSFSSCGYLVTHEDRGEAGRTRTLCVNQPGLAGR